MARIGLLGGTFNPPHTGHLVCAQEARVQLDLDLVLLVPARVPPHKPIADDPGIEHRVAMCEAAVAGDDLLGVSRVDADRPGPSFSVDMLRLLHATEPGDELTFIVGGDMALSLPTWREPEQILALARVGVVEREGARRTDIAARLATLGKARERVSFFEMPRIDLSSSMLRARARADLPLRYLVPERVADYIARAELYKLRSARPLPAESPRRAGRPLR